MAKLYFKSGVGKKGITQEMLQDLQDLLEVQNSTDKYEEYSSVIRKTDNATYEFKVDVDSDVLITQIY